MAIRKSVFCDECDLIIEPGKGVAIQGNVCATDSSTANGTGDVIIGDNFPPMPGTTKENIGKEHVFPQYKVGIRHYHVPCLIDKIRTTVRDQEEL